MLQMNDGLLPILSVVGRQVGHGLGILDKAGVMDAELPLKNFADSPLQNCATLGYGITELAADFLIHLSAPPPPGPPRAIAGRRTSDKTRVRDQRGSES